MSAVQNPSTHKTLTSGYRAPYRDWTGQDWVHRDAMAGPPDQPMLFDVTDSRGRVIATVKGTVHQDGSVTIPGVELAKR